MIQKFLLISGLVLCVMFSFSTVASAQTPTRPYAYYETFCGSATITFVNPTKSLFAFDYRVGDQAPRYSPNHPSFPGTIHQGPFIGQPFGPIYTIVNVPAGQTRTVTIALDEEQGGGAVEVMYKLQLGAEQEWFLLPVTFTVGTDCAPPDAAFVCLLTSDEAIPAPHYVQRWNGSSWAPWDAWVAQTWKGANYEISIHTNPAEYIYGDVYRIVGDNGSAVRYFERIQPGVCGEISNPETAAAASE